MADRPVALVTGANKGLGKETARQLLARGMTVVMGSRDAGRGIEAAGDLGADGAAVPVRLDVTDPAGVQAVAQRLRRDHGRLDVLVNNAGTVVDRLAAQTTADEMRRTYEVNVFGAVTVIHAMLPLLRAAAAPRIVNVSSTTASLGLTTGGTDFGGDADRRMAYTSSKTALNMLTVQYARAFAQDPGLSHIKINAATPGYTATDLTGHRGTRTVEEGARIIVDLAKAAGAGAGATGGFFNDQGRVPW
ncbi:SDR family NAD(P)-dependent oxidoreductase [Actinomadura darangshiensis]|uniref:SDR family NAD(P)-dependent oxidoreductase n=1 Tax=Actinomadura darangshiensis TaxID=705336 RepID=A0A4R5ABE2_9ACTN|nr:SDR family NAD(P)-dependent oxidoreductase [Actinomadura darangshiensis]TDD68995.1 SDR family NAD(P)-dependent oxidoreductase [Actinomadura darangshiensis]